MTADKDDQKQRFGQEFREAIQRAMVQTDVMPFRVIPPEVPRTTQAIIVRGTGTFTPPPSPPGETPPGG